MPMYEVIETASQTSMLVDAPNPAAARSFVAQKAYTVRVADSRRVAELFGEGLITKVHKVKEDATTS
jgi:hypothetical protein